MNIESFNLNTYRLLGNSGLRVSPLCLGTMTFGTEWGWGSDKETCKKIFHRYVEQGGNFIDTANFYTAGTSEQFVGEFIESKRDQFVLATKYTLNMRFGDPNAGGNHRKNIFQSVEASLKRLKTSYIDLYWVHMWDQLTPIEETMRALDDLVRSGKVLYIGISDMPAWKIAQANTLALLMNWTPFIALQIEYSAIKRTVERELIPMANDMGLGITPWSPLAGGLLTGKYNLEDKDKEDSKPSRKSFIKGGMTDKNFAIIDEIRKISQEINKTPSQIAINWLLQKEGVVSPIIGARTLDQLEENLGALGFSLTKEQTKRIDEISRIELGFPHDFLALPIIQNHMRGDTNIIK